MLTGSLYPRVIAEDLHASGTRHRRITIVIIFPPALPRGLTWAGFTRTPSWYNTTAALACTPTVDLDLVAYAKLRDKKSQVGVARTMACLFDANIAVKTIAPPVAGVRLLFFPLGPPSSRAGWPRTLGLG